MNFLVLLISLTVNYLWLKDFDRFDDAWFFRLRERLVTMLGDMPETAMRWLASIVLIYGIPLLGLAILLWFVADSLLGIPTMLVHILVLLIALDRTQPGDMAREFLRRWNNGDYEACAHYLENELGAGSTDSAKEEKSLGELFGEQFVYRCFERMFVMFFWYMLTGPLGVLFAYISYQLRDSHRQDQPAEEVEFVALVIAVLEWIPVRLLALTFSLAGNFVRCFESFKHALWTFDRQADTAAMLYGYSRCALTGLVNHDAEVDNEVSPSVEEQDRIQQAREIEALRSLLERSQAIWLVVLALITIFAL